MTSTEKVHPPLRPLLVGWPTLLSLLAALVAAGTAALHLIGSVSHRSYLRHWGIDAGLFPKPTDWILVNGYYSVVDRFVFFLTTLVDNLSWFAGAVVVLGLYVFILRTPMGEGPPGKSPQWVLRQPPWRRRLIRQMLLTGYFVCMVPGALYLVTAFLVVPALIGESAGRTAAEKETADYTKGCAESKLPCVELKKGKDTLVMGFVLDSSPSHIAIFDAGLQQGRVLPLEGLEMVTSRPRKLKRIEEGRSR